MEDDYTKQPYAKIIVRNEHGITERVYTLEESITCEIDIKLLRTISSNGVEVEYY